MKKFIFVSTALLSLSSFATTRDRDLFDLQYLPEKRTLFGITEASYQNYQYRDKEVASRSDQSIFSQTVGGSITDNLSIYVSSFYGNTRTMDRDRTESPDVTSHSSKDGAGDPSVSMKYRLQDNFFRFDVIGGYRFKSGEADGKNNKAGRPQWNFGFNFGQKFQLIQWSVLLNYFRQIEDGLVKASNSYSAEGALLWFVGDQSLVKASAMAYVIDPIGRSDRSTVSLLKLGPEYQFLFTEHFLMRAGVAYATTQVTSRDAFINEGWTYSLGANYQF